MGQVGDGMSEYSIRLEVPIRRGSTHLIVVIEDAQGNPIFRDSAKLNEEKTRTKVAARIAQVTGDDPDDIDRRLLHALATMQPPAGRGGTPGSQLAEYPYEATPGGLIWNKVTFEGTVSIPLATSLLPPPVLPNRCWDESPRPRGARQMEQ